MQTSHIVYRRSAKQNALPSTQKQCVVFPACWASSHIRVHRATLDACLIYGATQISRILVGQTSRGYQNNDIDRPSGGWLRWIVGSAGMGVQHPGDRRAA